jgi:hypothetical protein
MSYVIEVNVEDDCELIAIGYIGNVDFPMLTTKKIDNAQKISLYAATDFVSCNQKYFGGVYYSVVEVPDGVQTLADTVI